MSLAGLSDPSTPMPELDHSTPRRPTRAPSRVSLASSSSSTGAGAPPLAEDKSALSNSSRKAAHLRIASLTESTDSEATPRKRMPLPTPPQSETMSNGSSARLDLLPSLSLGANGNDNKMFEDEDDDHEQQQQRQQQQRQQQQQQREEEREAGNTSRRNRYPELERRSVSSRSSLNPLRRQASTATITNNEEDNSLGESTSTLRDEEKGPGKNREERRKRSAMHERELSQMRSESRLGDRGDDVDEQSPRKGSSSRQVSGGGGGGGGEEAAARAVQGGGTESTEDTSGTEGTGPVFDRRRRKKSTTSSSSRQHAKQSHHTSPTKDSVSSNSRREGEDDWERRSSASVASVRARNEYIQRRASLSPQVERHQGSSSVSNQGPFPSTRRAGLPLEFRSDRHTTQSRYRSDSIEDDEDPRQVPAEGPASDEVWPRGEEPSSARFRSSTSSTNSYRRRRYASDAQASDVPSSERERDLAAPSRNSRISVDASSVSRHLSRTVPRPSGGSGSSRDWEPNQISPSEAIRQRKISTSSSISQRSSGGASDVHRSASRNSMRRAYGRDVFDDERPPPMPALGPKVTSRDQDRKEKLHALRERQEKLKNTPMGGSKWWDELEDLRSRIDELSMDSHRSQSRASSRASAISSTRSRSKVGETPSHTLRRSRPMTEPRKGHGSNHDRTLSDQVFVPPLPPPTQAREGSRSRSGTLNESARRYASATYDNRRAPVTPDISSASTTVGRSSGSRMAHTGPTTSTSRFPSFGGAASEQAETMPLHERNLLNAFDVFDRHFSQSGQAGTPNSSNSMRGGPESMELVDRFREVSDSSTRINAGLRRLVQVTLEAQIDAELANSDAPSSATSTAFSILDRGLTHLLRDSDEQVRSLTDGLMVFTRAERERDRMRRVLGTSDQGSVGGRPGSRVSLLASPDTERGNNGSVDLDKPANDLRRAFSQRERMGVSLSVAGKSSASSTSQGSSELSGGSQRRTVAEATSPYSPTPYTGKGKEGIKSPTLSTAAHASSQRLRSTLGISHKRSNSELPSPRSPATEFRKDKTSNTSSNSTVKPPASLSPRRPKLSFPSVSTENALARNAVDIVDATTGEAVGDGSFASSAGELEESPSHKFAALSDDKVPKSLHAPAEPRRSGSSRTVWTVFDRPVTTEPEPKSADVENSRPSSLLRRQSSRSQHRASIATMSSPNEGPSPRQENQTVPISHQPGGGVGLNAASRMIRSLGRGAGRRISAHVDIDKELPSSSGISPND
ncbi:hypothetical protein FA10DRAFT_298771 [Acaromyces ingoldii]|uniref:Uncharacterized protein n=1 Tax=Acaromyces ingoldii TaxID=215250 RepID=A0A316YW09_9BASI|nr:hypothetical protein FA10DRAFT_298771 [Acaromyces ingoldii]PWN93371.1 hypothetical protein FA10DRAFT_298771 [Acaromyces ingoldii]